MKLKIAINLASVVFVAVLPSCRAPEAMSIPYADSNRAFREALRLADAATSGDAANLDGNLFQFADINYLHTVDINGLETITVLKRGEVGVVEVVQFRRRPLTGREIIYIDGMPIEGRLYINGVPVMEQPR